MGDNNNRPAHSGSDANVASTYQRNDAMLSQISLNFLNAETGEIAHTLYGTLHILQEYCGAATVSVLRLGDNQEETGAAYSWPNQEDNGERSQHDPQLLDAIRPHLPRLKRFETVVVSSVSDIPLEATAAREMALAREFRRLLLVPLILQEHLYGVLVLAGSTNGAQAWREDALPLLRNVANVIVTALNRKECDTSLRTSEALFRALAEQNAEGLALVSPETGHLSFANPALCRLAGYTHEELLQLSIKDLHPNTPDTFLKVLTTWESTVGEEILACKDGTQVSIEIAAFPVSIDGRKLILSSLRDISGRKQAEQERLALETQIQQAQKLESLGILAGGIAHDFNNLLVGILGNAGLALMDLAPESPVRGCIHEIELTAKRAAELVKQMLAYSGKGQFIVEPIKLKSLIEEMTHLLDVSISKKAVLKYEFAANTPPVEADAAQLRQVIMNLVTNASEAIADTSGVVAIATGAMECDHAYLSETYLDENLPEGIYSFIEISDTGCGMVPAIRDKIFDPFYSTKFTGRGLGLAAVLGIVRGHRGAIKIYSEPGRGTTIKVLFPALESAAERFTSSTAPRPAPQSFSGTVLLVDDEETVRAVGSRMLQKLGFDVITAVDGKEGIEIFKQDPSAINIVLLDLTMPHVDGEECFRELRRIRKDVCVILSSGYSEQELMSRFMGKGLAGFIQKPYQIGTLAQAFAEVTEKDHC